MHLPASDVKRHEIEARLVLSPNACSEEEVEVVALVVELDEGETCLAVCHFSVLGRRVEHALEDVRASLERHSSHGEGDFVRALNDDVRSGLGDKKDLGGGRHSGKSRCGVRVGGGGKICEASKRSREGQLV